MIELHPQYVINGEGKRVGVLLDISEFERLLEELENEQDVQAVRRAIASGEQGAPLEQAIAEIESEAG